MHAYPREQHPWTRHDLLALLVDCERVMPGTVLTDAHIWHAHLPQAANSRWAEWALA